MVIDHQYACGIRRRLWCRVRDLGVGSGGEGRGGEGVTSTADWPPFPAVVGQRLASTPPAYPSPWPAASHIHAIIELWGLHTWPNEVGSCSLSLKLLESSDEAVSGRTGRGPCLLARPKDRALNQARATAPSRCVATLAISEYGQDPRGVPDPCTRRGTPRLLQCVAMLPPAPCRRSYALSAPRRRGRGSPRSGVLRARDRCGQMEAGMSLGLDGVFGDGRVGHISTTPTRATSSAQGRRAERIPVSSCAFMTFNLRLAAPMPGARLLRSRAPLEACHISISRPPALRPRRRSPDGRSAARACCFGRRCS